jgi:hypothetical protein
MQNKKPPCQAAFYCLVFPVVAAAGCEGLRSKPFFRKHCGPLAAFGSDYKVPINIKRIFP